VSDTPKATGHTLFAQLVAVLALGVAGVDTLGSHASVTDAAEKLDSKVAASIEQLGRDMAHRDAAAAKETNELRMAVVVVAEQLKAIDRRVGILETQRSGPSKK